MPMGRNVLPWGEVSMERNVRRAKSPDTPGQHLSLQNVQGHRVTLDRVSDKFRVRINCIVRMYCNCSGVVWYDPVNPVSLYILH